MDTSPPPTTVDADWVQSPEETPRNSWTWPWPPAHHPMDGQDDVWPHNGTRVQHNDLTIYHRPKGIRHRADDILSRSILAMIRENGSIKPIAYVVASASAVAAAILSLRRRAH